jgi:acetoacetyl-CoA synthetase
MKKRLWTPAEEIIESSNVFDFINFVNKKENLDLENYQEIYNWSIENIPRFWELCWEYCRVIYSNKYEQVVDDLNKFPGARWFIGAKLNFAENLLKYRDSHKALISYSESGKIKELTYLELYNEVAKLYDALKDTVKAGDRVAAYMPNISETIIAMLASTSLGAIWSSCGTELGHVAVVDRIGQLNPKVLFTVDGYYYKGKYIDVLPNVEKIVKEISSIEKVIVFPYVKEKPQIKDIPKTILYNEFIASSALKDIKFEQVESNHPVYIMFSSGTTGKPKCMVQSVTGVLINHLKELILHTDLKRKDKITYITSPSWMMWNWLVSSLAVGATIVIYDGNPIYPDWGKMWKIVEDEGITIFGCSATYINSLRSVNAVPKEKFSLDSLREISQTGSPLSAEGFEYVYTHIKSDLHFNSISGGTDINGCFVAGTPIQPVYAGEIQGPALGMKVNAYDEKGNPVRDREAELVCEAPSPSMPIYFWNDPENKKYIEAYFSYYKGIKNVWRHGDLIIYHSDTSGITILGRSDFTLKPSGVRIGPAEIYRVVEKFKEIADSLAVGQKWKDDERIILFVKMAQGYKLTEELKERIKKALREEASPRHVPALIFEVPDIPYTYNMKKVESAVYNIINGKPVTNRDALINPESLDYFEKLLPLLKE